MESAGRCFFVWNGVTPWKMLLKIDGSNTNDIMCGLQTDMPKASTIVAFISLRYTALGVFPDLYIPCKHPAMNERICRAAWCWHHA